MPRVPTLDSPTVSTGITPGARFDAPEVRNIPAQQLQQAVQAVSGLASDLIRVQSAIQQDANRLRLDDAATQAQRRMLALEQQYKQFRGRDAIERGDKALDDEFDEMLGKELDAIGAGLGNEAQKQAWALESGQMRRQFRSGVTAHLASEYKTYDTQVQQGKIATGVEMMPRVYDRPEDLERARGAIRDGVSRIHAGAPAEYVAAETVKALTPGHVAVIQSMIQSGQVTAARDYFARPDVQSELTREASGRLSDVLTTAGRDLTGQQAAREVMASMAGATPKEIDAALVQRLGGDPAALEVARREAKFQRDLEDDARKAVSTRLMEPVMAMVGDARLNGRLIDRKQSEQALAGLRLSAPAEYDRAARIIDKHNDEIRNERRAAEDRAQAASDRAKRDGLAGDEASASAWYTLKTNPKALRVTNLLELRGRGILSEKHFADLVGDQKSLLEKKSSDESILSDKAAVDMVLNAAKIDTKKDDNQAKLALFYERFNQRVREVRPTDQAGKVAIARELLGEVVKERSFWFDGTQRAFEVEVPAAERAQIIVALRRAGKPVTETNIVNLYQSGQKK